MNLEPLPAWLLPVWQDLRSRQGRLAHALLLTGPHGSGKRLFAEHFARALLCQHPDEQGFACGRCPDCTWMASGNHPDYFALVSAADEAEADDGGEGAESTGKKEKAKSTQIVIDQVRGLQASLEVGAGGHAGGWRVVIVDPAEAMNVAAANSLLKALEEPAGNTLYLMLSNAPRRLLPTIRSRCQVLPFPRPAAPLADRWMDANGIANKALLGFASGLPLAARELASGPLADARTKLAGDLAARPVKDPLRLAAEWESRLKAKGAAEAGLNMAVFIDWLERWLSDGVWVGMGQHARFFADFEEDLAAQARGHGDAWLAAYREVQAQRPIALHPLNLRLFLEDLFVGVFRRLAVR